MTVAASSKRLNPLTALLATTNDGSLLALRLAAAIVIWPHGAQKVFGWFGGYGLQGTLQGLASMGIPPFFAWLAIAAEFLGGLALLLGLFTRVAAFGIFSTMAVAMLMVHLKNGFFMNWSGKQPGEGIEYFVYALAVLGVLVWKGGGRASVDRSLSSSN